MCTVCGVDSCMEVAIAGLVTKRDANKSPLKPIQKMTRGIPGYKKPVRLYDPDHPHISFVQEGEDDVEPSPTRESPVHEPRIRVVDDA